MKGNTKAISLSAQDNSVPVTPPPLPLTTDQRLRAAGYKIKARPEHGLVIWQDKDGFSFTQREALLKLQRTF